MSKHFTWGINMSYKFEDMCHLLTHSGRVGNTAHSNSQSEGLWILSLFAFIETAHHHHHHWVIVYDVHNKKCSILLMWLKNIYAILLSFENDIKLYPVSIYTWRRIGIVLIRDNVITVCALKGAALSLAKRTGLCRNVSGTDSRLCTVDIKILTLNYPL